MSCSHSGSVKLHMPALLLSVYDEHCWHGPAQRLASNVKYRWNCLTQRGECKVRTSKVNEWSALGKAEPQQL